MQHRRRFRPVAATLVTALALLCLPPIANTAAAQVRLKDLVTVAGVRSNQLVGYGLVIGLAGTGDTLRNSPMTQGSLAAMLERMGVSITDQRVQTRNTAAVMVTATLPPSARQGTPIDVQVSSMGDAKSLQGGVLIVTPLLGADGEAYAVAQGSVVLGGFQAAGQATSVSSGTVTAGRVPGGAIVEREVPNSLGTSPTLQLALRTPDFTTAARVEEVLNRQFGQGTATTLDLGTIEVRVPPAFRTRVPGLMAQIESLRIQPETQARVVIDERTGTVVVGADVRINTVAVTHGNLVVKVTETPQVSQPEGFSDGQTAIVPRTDVQVDDQRGKLLAVVPRNATLQDLVKGLNALGLAPRDLISVINAMKAAGAIHADVVFM